MRFPELVAHRGYALRYPENTLAACAAAFEAGARNIEVDVQISADGTPFLCHDATLERVCGRPVSLADLTDAEVAELCASEPERLGATFAREPVASLEAFCDLLGRSPDARRAFIEVKPVAVDRHGARATLRAVLERLEPVRERCILISFSAELLTAARGERGLELGLILADWGQLESDDARRLAPEYTFCDHRKLPPAGSFERPGTRFAVYEVVDARQALDLAARGADFVETFAIVEMIAAFARMGAAR